MLRFRVGCRILNGREPLSVVKRLLVLEVNRLRCEPSVWLAHRCVVLQLDV